MGINSIKQVAFFPGEEMKTATLDDFAIIQYADEWLLPPFP